MALHWVTVMVAAALGSGPDHHARESRPQAPAGAFIDPEAVEVQELEEMSLEQLLKVRIVTSSGGTKESAAKAAANITVIGSDEIARHGWRSLAQVLAYVPGLWVIDDLVMPSVSVRGLNGGVRSGTRLLKIMVNGVEVNFRPDLTAFLGPEFIPVGAIEQIEIAMGPLSALYGANAFLATINVLTKAAPPGLHGQLALQGNHQQSAPSPGYGGSGAVTYGSESLDVVAAVSAARDDRSGLRIARTFASQSLPRFEHFFREPSRGDVSRPASAYLRIDWRGGKVGNWTAQGGLQSLDANGEFLLNSELTHRSRLALYNAWGSLAGQKEFGDRLSVKASIGLGQGGPRPQTALYLPSADTSRYVPRYGFTALTGAAALKLGFDRAEVSVGGDCTYDLESVLFYDNLALGSTTPLQDSSALTKQRALTSGGLYAAGTATPLRSLEGLRLVGNLRVDTLQYGPAVQPAQVSWRGAVSYEFSEAVTAKLFAGRAFQGPSATLLFAVPGSFGFGNQANIIGQYDLFERGLAASLLKPQVAGSIEAAVTARLFGLLLLETGVFLQQVDDLIEFAQYGSDFVAKNGGRARFAGFSLNARLVTPRVAARLAGSYVQLVSNEERRSAAPQAAMPMFPSVDVVGAVDLFLPEVLLRASIIGRLVGERGASASNALLNNLTFYTLPPWADFDLALSSKGLKLVPRAEETVFTLAVRNVVGRSRSEPGFGGFDLPSVGRSFFLEARQAF